MPQKQNDKLENGPCAEAFSRIKECGKAQGIDQRNHKQKLEACPGETDALIKCMNKHPLHFHK